MNLFEKLGPQGRALVKNDGNANRLRSNYSFQDTTGVRMPNKLDYLLNDMVDPNTSTTVDQFLSYIAYYYPTLKNEYNIELLTFHFLKSPLFFGDSSSCSFVQLYKVIECFGYIIDKKLNVSVPSLPFYKFYNSVLQGILKFISTDPIDSNWKVLPMLSGILFSIQRRSEHFCRSDHIGFIEKVDIHLNKIMCGCLFKFNKSQFPNPDRWEQWKLIYITVLSLNHNSIPDNNLIQILNRSRDLPLLLLDNLLNFEYGFKKGNILLASDNNVSELPVLKNMSSFAKLYGRLIQLNYNARENIDLIDISMNKIQFFSRDLFDIYFDLEQKNTINDVNSKDAILKNCLFSIIMILESMTQFCFYQNPDHINKPEWKFYLRNITRKIMISLFNLNFVIEKVGTGGFESFNFVYLSIIDYLISPRNGHSEQDFHQIEQLNQIFSSSVQFSELANSFAQRSKLLFCLNFVEHSINLCSNEVRLNLLLPLVEEIINKNVFLINDKVKLKPLLETSHSIMLKYFGILQSYQWSAPTPRFNFSQNYAKIHDSIIPYFNNIITSQYPSLLLSSNQYLIITEQLCRLLSPNSAIYAQNPILFSSFLENQYQFIKSRDTPMIPLVSQDSSTELHTSKSVMIQGLIRSVSLSTHDELIMWLDRIYYELIQDQGLRFDEEDKTLLLDSLFDCVLAMNRSDAEKGAIGIDWFYTTVNNNRPRL